MTMLRLPPPRHPLGGGKFRTTRRTLEKERAIDAHEVGDKEGEDDRYDGTAGTVAPIDSHGQSHSSWCCLAVILYADRFVIVEWAE